MFTNCLSCGQVIYDRGAIRWPTSEHVQPLRSGIEQNGQKLFIRCPNCSKRNFFIKEYVDARTFLRISHVEQ